MLTLFVLLLVLAIAFGGVGVFANGLGWLLIIALVLLVLSGGTGYYHYGHRHD